MNKKIKIVYCLPSLYIPGGMDTLFFAADDSRRKTCTLLRKYSVSACGMRLF